MGLCRLGIFRYHTTSSGGVIEIVVWVYIVITVLFAIDMLSTLWLNAHVPGSELNPVMAATLTCHFTHSIVKAIILGVILIALCRLETLSLRTFRWASVSVCVIYGLVCVHNLIGVFMFW